MLFCAGGTIGVQNVMQCSLRIRIMRLMETATADLALVSIHWKKPAATASAALPLPPQVYAALPIGASVVMRFIRQPI